MYVLFMSHIIYDTQRTMKNTDIWLSLARSYMVVSMFPMRATAVYGHVVTRCFSFTNIRACRRRRGYRPSPALMSTAQVLRLSTTSNRSSTVLPNFHLLPSTFGCSELYCRSLCYTTCTTTPTTCEHAMMALLGLLSHLWHIDDSIPRVSCMCRLHYRCLHA